MSASRMYRSFYAIYRTSLVHSVIASMFANHALGLHSENGFIIPFFFFNAALIRPTIGFQFQKSYAQSKHTLLKDVAKEKSYSEKVASLHGKKLARFERKSAK